MPEITVKLGDSERKYVFDKDVVNIGRSKENEIILDSLRVSRNHARIRRQDEHYVILDLESSNGTFVNGTRVSRSDLADGDVISIHKHTLRFATQSLSPEQAEHEAFNAERTILSTAEPVGVLVVLNGKQQNQEFVIERQETTIGRLKGSTIWLTDWLVSKRHAVLRRQGNRFILSDAGSSRGVKVNSVTIKEPRVLAHGDTIQIGPVPMRFMMRDLQAASAVALPPAIEVPDAGLEAAEMAQAAEELEKEMADMMAMSSKLEDVEEEGQSEVVPESTVGGGCATLSEPELPEPELAEGGSVTLLEPEPEAVSTAEGGYATEVAAEPLLDPEMIPGANDFVVAEELDEQAAEDPAETPAAPTHMTSESSGSVSPEIALWEKALQNPSGVIRREAARKLKKLTGRDYDV